MKATPFKAFTAATALVLTFSSVANPVFALTVPEAITSIQTSNPTLPTGVPNPKGNIGFLLANMFWNSSDVGYDSTKFGKIKPQFFDGAGATAWTYAGGNTYMTDMNGRVGIGTNDPQAYLHLKSNLNDNSPAMLLESPAAQYGSPRIAFVDTSSGSLDSRPAWMVDNSFDRFRVFRQPNLTTPGLAHLLINSSWSVSVGSQVDVYDAKASFEVRRGQADSEYAAWIEGMNSNNLWLGVNVASVSSSKAIANFKSANTSRLIVRADGKVGIGTSVPESVLDVNGDVSVYTRLKYASIGGDYFWLRSRLWTEPNALSVGIESDEATGTTKTIRMLTNGVWRFFIAQDGKVGIWTLNPSATLDVNGQIRIAWGSPGVGKILTSDASGLATWTSPSSAYSETDPKVATTSSGYLARWNGAALVSASIFDNGNVGISTGIPSIKLAVWDSDTGFDWIGDGKLDIYSNNVIAMAVRGHNVGLWTSAPSARLHSEAAGNLNNSTNSPNISDISGFFGSSATDGIGLDGNQIERIGVGPLNVNYNSTSNLILNYGLWVGGNVGIGIVNPTQKLEVAGVTTATGFRAQQGIPDNSDSSTRWYAFGADGDTWMFAAGSGSNNGTLAFYGNNVELMRILPTLSVGIGTTNPAATLEVKRSVADSNYAAWIEGTDAWNFGLGVNIANTTTTKAVADFRSANISRLHIRADGNVGVGTTTPTTRFNVVGSSNFSRDNASECCSSNDYTVAISELTNSSGKTASLQFHNSWVSEGYFRLAWSGSRRFQIGDNQGQTAGLQMSGNLQVDGTGSSYVAWKFWIWTSAPAYKLDVAGTANVTGFRMPTGAGAGKVLTSDASGLATWATPAAGGGITAVTTASCTYGEWYGCTATCPATYTRVACASGGSTYAWFTPSWSTACVFTTSNMSGPWYAFCAK